MPNIKKFIEYIKESFPGDKLILDKSRFNDILIDISYYIYEDSFYREDFFNYYLPNVVLPYLTKKGHKINKMDLINFCTRTERLTWDTFIDYNELKRRVSEIGINIDENPHIYIDSLYIITKYKNPKSDIKIDEVFYEKILDTCNVIIEAESEYKDFFSHELIDHTIAHSNRKFFGESQINEKIEDILNKLPLSNNTDVNYYTDLKEICMDKNYLGVNIDYINSVWLKAIYIKHIVKGASMKAILKINK